LNAINFVTYLVEMREVQ